MAEEAPTYELKIEGSGLSLSRKIDENALRNILHLILSASETGPTPPPYSPQVSSSHTTETVRPTSSRVSLREHLTDTGAKRNPDKIVVIADYLERIEGLPGFTRDDIKARFRAAGESPPGNYPRDFAWTVSNGWIAEDPHAKGQYYVTRTGQNAIEAGFSSDVAKTSRLKPNRRRRGRVGIVDGGEE